MNSDSFKKSNFQFGTCQRRISNFVSIQIFLIHRWKSLSRLIEFWKSFIRSKRYQITYSATMQTKPASGNTFDLNPMQYFCFGSKHNVFRCSFFAHRPKRHQRRCQGLENIPHRRSSVCNIVLDFLSNGRHDLRSLMAMSERCRNHWCGITTDIEYFSWCNGNCRYLFNLWKPTNLKGL